MLIMIGRESGKVLLADSDGNPVALLELDGEKLMGYASRKVFLLALRRLFTEMRVYIDHVEGIPIPELKDAWINGIETGDYETLVEKIVQFVGITNPSLN
jgi:hypothetical protein